MIELTAVHHAGMNHIRAGSGKPLVLLHGLGGSWRSWAPVIPTLAAEREVIALDLPGFGETPPLSGEVSVATLADAVTAFLDEQGLGGVDVAGSSMGARLALELARRGVVGAVVALDPGGFWAGWQQHFFYWSIRASIALVRLLQPVMPLLTAHPIPRTLLLAQFSARPWDLSPALMLTELHSMATAPSFDPLLGQLVNGPAQAGAVEPTPGPIVIVWGRQDRVCFPNQAKKAQALFPHAKLVWFESYGHFPQWDLPNRTAGLILATVR
jgi:pimeloyl-ACP methyl ester carboxylesterase